MSYGPRKRLADKNAVDDLVMLERIEESAIVQCLQNRYAKDWIYTNVGPVLIAINPFKNIREYYTEARIREYKGKKSYELPPHVYAVADEAYSNMISYRENQCVIITGESGSGKTETSKIFMQYISGVSGKGAEVVRVKDRMLASNPILEGFGNAKTVNNNNSSRFGKYMEILFDLGGDPVGGRVTNYLLEKSRVVGPSQGERNFHIFYQICNGADAQSRQNFCLEKPDYFYYLSCTGCYEVPGIDDLADYKELMAAFHTVGIAQNEISEVFRVVSAVLWLGNISFTEDHAEKAAVQDRRVVEIVASLLQVDAGALENCLITRQIQTGTGARAEKYSKPNTAAASDFCRDTLAKSLYSRLFDYLVYRINESIKKENFQGIQIGVLDIYGFEIFRLNSFEQICINFVNEMLQQVFIDLTLKQEQAEYKAENIPWRDIPYTDNAPLCQLISGKPGLLTLADDCCHTNKSDQMFVQDLKGFFSGSPYIMCTSSDFIIKHYAGDVRYESNGFLTKNKDSLYDDLILVVQSSPCEFVRSHGWAALEITEGQKKRPITVGAQFNQQVNLLMATLRSCVPHYIRCIKPNNEKTPNTFDRDNVTRQAKYLGLLENVRVRRAGYAHRSPFDRFIRRYALLNKQIWSGRARGDARALCGVLAQGLGWQLNREFAMGKTKIFIQDANVLFALEDYLERATNDAVMIIQRAYRNYKQKRYFLETRADIFDIFNGRKERRRGSLNRDYKGDYLAFHGNKLVIGLLSQDGHKERMLFADRVNFVTLRGKQGAFKTIFGKKVEEPILSRFLVLSEKALYSFEFFLNPENNMTEIQLYFRVPLLSIASITTSPYADNYFIIHFVDSPGPGNQPGSGPRDGLYSCRRKTELIGLLALAVKIQGRAMFDLRFQDKDNIAVGKQKQKFANVTWLKDETINSNQDMMIRVKHDVKITMPSGMPPNQVQAPFRPAKLEGAGSARPALKALYDCQGNGTDELDFRTGDTIWIVKEEDGGWFEGELNGRRGFVPATYVERIKRQALNTAKPAAQKKPTPGTGGGFQFGGAAAAASPWKELKSDQGDTYYFNESTGVSQWEKPAELNTPAPAPMPVATNAAPKFGGGGGGFGGGGGGGFGGSSNSSSNGFGGGNATKFGGGASSASTAMPAAGGRPAFGGGASAVSSNSNNSVSSGFGAKPSGGGFVAPSAGGRPGGFGGATGGSGNVVNRMASPVNSAPSSAKSSRNNSPTRSAGGGIADRMANLNMGGGGFGAPKPMGMGGDRAPAPVGAGAGPARNFQAPKAGGAGAGPSPMANRPAVGGGGGGGFGGRPAGGAGAGPGAAFMAGRPAAGGGASAAPGGFGARPGPPMAMKAPAPAKSDWERVHDSNSGQDYFYNAKTGATQWDKPAGFNG